ncbi:MAG: aminoacyl-tRNA hydrolase [Bacilli bacterium]|nr:aminoacyl-tRNA hydrolase [Bacilli bacterium]
MKLVVGLGNPGRQYENTRHNMGFMAVDKFAEMAKADFDRNMFKGTYAICKNPAFDDTIIILKPETLMNLSGECVQQMMHYFKIETEDVIVVYDDMALEPGKIRLRPFGSSGGQKGMQNIIDNVGTDQIKRIRVGIGEPPHGGVDWVLGKPSGEDLEKLNEATSNAARAIRDALLKGWSFAMNHYNGKEN